MKTNAAYQPGISTTLRVCAAGCALVWLVGMVVCGMERMCSCASHQKSCAGHASLAHSHEHAAVATPEHEHAHDAEHHHAAEAHEHATVPHHHDGEAQHGCGGKNGCEDKRCCSTIQAFVQTPSSIVIPKRVSQPVLMISVLCAAREHALAASQGETLRQAKPRDWVFTPEVCLGPALHSLAPPASA